MVLINNLHFPLDTDFSNIKDAVARQLKTDSANIISAKLLKRSVDARNKSQVHFCCSVIVTAKNENKLCKYSNVQKYEPQEYKWPICNITPSHRPVIVGFGPAGMFAALCLARAGLKPIVVERGKCAEERAIDIKNFFEGGKLNSESNVQFGEGGAGTFSDGKLNTGIKDVRLRTVLEEFVRFGASENILIDAKPHIGTDILIKIVSNIRKEIINLGGSVMFSSKLEKIHTENGILKSITVNGKKMDCSHLILACGHSARDTFLMLKNLGVAMERKPFSMGVRIEHLQSDINRALYGDNAKHPALSAADYKLAVHLPSGRGVYTFCMCPGGEVINASSEQCTITVNGMSNSRRDGKNANSALLVGIEPEDIEGDDVLGGCLFQREIETKAFNIGKGAVPVTTVGEFLYGEEPKEKGVTPTVKPATIKADLGEIFPEFIVNALKDALPLFDKKIKGFAAPDAILSAPETRSSSPVRILRNATFQSESIGGLFPCGEGAGYAGGIMSAATDGIKVAEALIKSLEVIEEKI